MRPRPLRALTAGLALLGAGCGEGDPLGNLRPEVREGGGRIWEVSAEQLPSAFDIVSGRRLFLGSGDIGPTAGDIFLEGTPGSTELRLRSVASLLRAQASHAVELQDLGEVDFATLEGVPDDGDYLDSEDSTGVAAVQGHVYALRIRRSELPPNFAKLVIDAVGTTADDPDQQFIDFRFAVQIQPGNPRFDTED